MANNTIAMTSKTDVQERQKFAAQNIIEELRLRKESKIRALNLLEKRLSSLRMDETRLLNKLYPTITVEKLAEKRAGSQSTVLDIQAFDPYDMDVNIPTERVTTFYEKLKNSVKSLNALLVSKQTDIKETLAAIKEIQDELEDVNKQLASNGAPTEADMETDRILRRQSSEVMMLWEVYQQYNVYSTTVNGGIGFSEDDKVVAIVDSLEKRFTELGKQSGLSLNFNNIRSISNEKVIRNRMETLKVSMVQSKVPERLSSEIDSMQRYSNDPYSAGVNRREPNPPLPEDNSMDQQTKTASRFLRATQSVAGWTTSFDLTDVIDAKSRRFFRETSDLNNGCPMCEKLPTTEESKKREAQEAKDTALDEEATTTASEKISKQEEAEPPEPVTGLFSMIRGMFKAVDFLQTVALEPDSKIYETLKKQLSISTTGPIYLAQGVSADRSERFETDLGAQKNAEALSIAEENQVASSGIASSGFITENGSLVYYSYGYAVGTTAAGTSAGVESEEGTALS